jgi:hypothetical protein
MIKVTYEVILAVLLFFLQQYRQNRILFISLIHGLKPIAIDFKVPSTCLIWKELDGMQ